MSYTQVLTLYQSQPTRSLSENLYSIFSIGALRGQTGDLASTFPGPFPKQSHMSLGTHGHQRPHITSLLHPTTEGRRLLKGIENRHLNSHAPIRILCAGDLIHETRPRAHYTHMSFCSTHVDARRGNSSHHLGISPASQWDRDDLSLSRLNALYTDRPSID